MKLKTFRFSGHSNTHTFTKYLMPTFYYKNILHVNQGSNKKTYCNFEMFVLLIVGYIYFLSLRYVIMYYLCYTAPSSTMQVLHQGSNRHCGYDRACRDVTAGWFGVIDEPLINKRPKN